LPLETGQTNGSTIALQESVPCSINYCNTFIMYRSLKNSSNRHVTNMPTQLMEQTLSSFSTTVRL
jgi:hypothetical protein